MSIMERIATWWRPRCACCGRRGGRHARGCVELGPFTEIPDDVLERRCQLGEQAERADAIRANVDAAWPRYLDDGTVNIHHVVTEQNLRRAAGLPSTILRLDGLSFRRPTDPPRGGW